MAVWASMSVKRMVRMGEGSAVATAWPRTCARHKGLDLGGQLVDVAGPGHRGCPFVEYQLGIRLVGHEVADHTFWRGGVAVMDYESRGFQRL